jgi:hypothetical protein
MRRHRTNAVRLVVLVGWLLGVAGGGHAQSLDPQSLIGDWVGTWQGKLASASGPYRLVVEQVNGDKVLGHVETTSGRSKQNAPTSFKIAGAVKGNHLTYGTKNYQVDLEVNGSEMRGTWTGLAHRDLTLVKQK